MAYSNLIENLTQELALFQKMGGDIYAPRRTLPYYERLRSAKRAYKRETGKDLTAEDIYRDCGIKFNRDYHVFSQFVEGLSKIATPDKKVDIIKTSKLPADKVELKSYLNFHANNLGISPGEYLILMTDYRYESLTISGDYVANLQARFNKAYPRGVVSNLKAENASLYWALKHFQEYCPEDLSYNEALAFFGLKNISARGPEDTKQAPINEDYIVGKLEEKYPTREIKDIFSNDPKLYYTVVKLAVRNDQTVSQWFDSHGMKYAQGNNCTRLSRYRVDAQEHEQMLLGLRDELLQEYDTTNADAIDMYEINLDITKRIAEKLYGKTQDSSETEQQTNTQPEEISQEVIALQPPEEVASIDFSKKQALPQKESGTDLPVMSEAGPVIPVEQ